MDKAIDHRLHSVWDATAEVEPGKYVRAIGAVCNCGAVLFSFPGRDFGMEVVHEEHVGGKCGVPYRLKVRSQGHGAPVGYFSPGNAGRPLCTGSH